MTRQQLMIGWSLVVVVVNGMRVPARMHSRRLHGPVFRRLQLERLARHLRAKKSQLVLHGETESLANPKLHQNHTRGKKKSAKSEKSSSRQHERRQSTPSIAPTKKNDKRRSLVTIHNETTPFTESWREGPPHKTPEVEDEERAKSYEIKVQLGSIIPPKEIVAELAKAHLQLAREKAQSFENTPVTEESSPVDPGVNWVNCGPSRLGGKPDPERSFEQRSRPAGATWGKDSGWPKLSE